METTEELATFLVQVGFDDFPPETVKLAKELAMHAVGAMLAGSVQPASKIVAKHVKAMRGKAEAGYIGGPLRVPVSNAAFVNGLSGHALELEDDALSGVSTVTV